MDVTKAYLLLTGNGAMLILTEYDFIKQPGLLKTLAVGGPKKFVAHEVSIDWIKKSYTVNFENPLSDLKQKDKNDKIKVLDDEGQRIFENITLKELGNLSITRKILHLSEGVLERNPLKLHLPNPNKKCKSSIRRAKYGTD